jgi:DNA-binding CsgD family transcriptional regulator
MHQEAFTQEQFDHAVRLIYDAALDPARMPDALGAVAVATGARGGMLGIYDPCTGDGHAPWIGRLAEELLPLYEQRYPLNPYTLRVASHAVPGRALSLDPLVDQRALHRSAFYDDILAPQGIGGQSFYLLRKDGRYSVGLSLMHADAERSTDARVLRIHEQLGHHKYRAFELWRHNDTLRAQLDMAEAALDQHRCAVLQLAADATIRFANARARCLMAEGDGLLSHGQRVTARHNGDGARLAAAVAAAAASGTATAISLPLRRGPLRLPLLAIVLPAGETRCIVGAPPADGSAGALLFVADPSERGTVPADLLREAFGLTDREVSVALATVRLGSLPAAAAELGIAPSTARSHLQRVFDKTDTRNQLALANLLSVSGALPKALAGN